jgi:transposase
MEAVLRVASTAVAVRARKQNPAGQVASEHKRAQGSTHSTRREVFTMSRNTTLERKAVYVGIDYHKQFSVLTFGDRQGNVLEQLKLVNETSLVEKFFARFGPLECAIESCRGYEWLLELLLEQGHRVHMGDSRSIKLIAVTRCKTDKIDSKILMELLAKGFLPEAYTPSAKERDYRELLRHRVQLVRTQVRHKLRVHSLLDKENKGIRYPFSVKRTPAADAIGRIARYRLYRGTSARTGRKDQTSLSL